VNRLLHVRAVFFDAVGTLLFPNPPAADVYAQVAARHDLRITVNEIRKRFLSAYRAEEVADRAAGWRTGEEREVRRWRRIVGESLAGVRDPEDCFQELFRHFGRPHAWQVNPSAVEVLGELRARGIRLGIGSNYDARLHSVLDGIPDLSPLRERAVISAQVGFRKPAGEFFREVVHVAGGEPREILFVGDDLENDYEGARRAELKSVLLAPRTEPLNAARVNDLKDLLE